MFGLNRKPPKGGWPIERSKMTWLPADPNSQSTTDFDCGSEWYEREINNTVQEGKWALNPDVGAFEFFLNGKTVGYAFVVDKRYPYPDWVSTREEYVRVIYTAGINKRYRGKPDPYPGSDETLAEVMFRVIEELPREVIRKDKVVGCVVGLFLQVYVENHHARRFYEKIKFTQDIPRGETSSAKHPQPTISLRKDLP